jgi:hypothetical protein
MAEMVEEVKSEDDQEEQREIWNGIKDRLKRDLGQLPSGDQDQVHKVHTSEILKAFRSKEDFIKILSIEGKLLYTRLLIPRPDLD